MSVLFVSNGLDRSSKTPSDVLGDSTGALVCDGYTGYNVVEDPEQRVRGGCWCHVRRKFFEAKTNAPVEAERAITEMRELFRIEHEASGRGIVGTSKHLELRRERSRPVIDKLFELDRTNAKSVLTQESDRQRHAVHDQSTQTA